MGEMGGGGEVKGPPTVSLAKQILLYIKGYSSKVYHPGGDGILKKF